MVYKIPGERVLTGWIATTFQRPGRPVDLAVAQFIKFSAKTEECLMMSRIIKIGELVEANEASV
mgnify:CR=1 FL=1